ncbi:centromere protein w [Anaeramoeba ignava]|uniref:Centromere protein w n=1 Tax=Anaeramoeba ignava TaxID=1746090 RepID=A0A9Q0LM16_ANAIG|nr:centromere protein w [Anaeramoeba ignava]
MIIENKNSEGLQWEEIKGIDLDLFEEVISESRNSLQKIDDVLCLVEYLYFLKLLAKECEHDAQKNEEKKITKESVDSVFPVTNFYFYFIKSHFKKKND